MRIGAALLSLALTTSAWALDYRSAADNAVLYDAPSAKGVKSFIVARGTPVEVVMTQDAWTKVRDSAGHMAWIETRLLAPTRTLQVKVDKADVRGAADDKSPVVFAADRDVLLDLIETAPPGWAKVKHRDGQSGFVRASQVWGL